MFSTKLNYENIPWHLTLFLNIFFILHEPIIIDDYYSLIVSTKWRATFEVRMSTKIIESADQLVLYYKIYFIPNIWCNGRMKICLRNFHTFSLISF